MTQPQPQPSILLAGFNGRLFGLDPRTGAIRWEIDEFDNQPMRLFVTETHSLALGGGKLVCLDTPSGRIHWRADTHGDTLLYPGGELIFVAVSGETECFAVRTGQRVWHQKFKGKGMGGVSLGVPGHVAQVDYWQS